MECKLKNAIVHYEEFGSGRLFVALHGRPLDHRHVQNDLEPLFVSRKGWRRLYPDLPGMGRTSVTGRIESRDHVLDTLLEFIDTVAPGERFVVEGTSFGGSLARALVYRVGERIDGMFINVPAVVSSSKEDIPAHQVVREDAQFLSSLTSDEVDVQNLVVTQSMGVLEQFRTYINPAVAIADRDFVDRLKPFSFDIDSLETPFPAPALILTGRFDNMCGYRAAYRLIDNFPRATFAVLDGAGHALSMEQKTLFRALGNDWLNRVEEYCEHSSK